MAIDGGMRDKIAAITGSAETAEQVLQLFTWVFNYETPADSDERQDEMPGVLKSFRTVMYQSVPEPAPDKDQPHQ